MPKKSQPPDDLKKKMADLLRSCGIFLTPDQLGKLWIYHQLLREYNPILNLTRIHRFADMVEKLYADSMLPGILIELPSPLMDMGTGPGMPGIPLKILKPELEMILAESRQNRVDFLTLAVHRIGLTGIRVMGRAVSRAVEEPVQAVITRAVAAVSDILERIRGCLVCGGKAVLMKGPRCDEEIAQAVERFSDSYRLVEDRAYRIGNTSHQRRLVVFERTDTPASVIKRAAMTRHPTRRIDSSRNEIFRDLKKCLTGKGIRKTGTAIISGEKQVREFIETRPEPVRAWITRTDTAPPPDTLPNESAWHQLAPELFHELDLFGTGHPLIQIQVPAIPPWSPDEGFESGCTLLAPFQDPENVGAVVRSAAAFGVRAVILLAESAHPYHPKAIRASGGAVFSVRFFSGPSIRDLPGTLPLVALSAEGRNIADFRFPEAFGLLPGVEGPGLPEDRRAVSVAIPISGEVESLNAAAAVSIALYLWRRQRAG